MARVSPFVIAAVVLSSCTGLTEDEKELPAPKIVSEVGPIDASAPPKTLLQDEVLVVSTLVENRRVEAFDVSSGESLWKVDEVAMQYAWVGDDFVVLMAEDDRVEILDLATGEMRHEITLEPDNMGGDRSALLEVTNTTIFLTNAQEKEGEALSAVDVETGDQLWEEVLDDKDEFVAAPSLLSTSSSDDPLSELIPASDAPFWMIGLRSQEDWLTAVDAETGDELWHQERNTDSLAHTYTLALDEEWAATVVTEPDESCRSALQVIQTETGDVHDITIHRFTYDDDQWACSDNSGVTTDGGVILTQDAERHPQAIDLATGDEIWTAKETGEPLAIADETASYRTPDDDVVAVDLKSGKKRWDSDTLPHKRGVVANDMLLVSGGGETIATTISNNNPRWHKKDASVLTHDDEHIAFSHEVSDGYMIPVTTHDPH